MEGGEVLTFAGTRAGFEQGFGQLRAILDRYPLQSRTRYGCELVYEEIVSNIIRHGYADNQEHRISMTVAVQDDRVELHFEDDGMAFDPRQPVLTRAEAPPDSDSGGRGLVLLRSIAERIDYERTPQQRNHLRVTVATDPRW